METPVDKRIIKAIVTAVRFELEYAVPLANIEWFVRAQGQTEGEGYRLLGDFYDALNEGRLKGAYLIKLGNDIEQVGILVVPPMELTSDRPDILVVSPVELTNEQLETLDVVVRWVTALSGVCKCPIRREHLVQSITNALITVWSGERYDKGVYKFAINNGITSASELDNEGIGFPSPTKSSKTKEGGE